LAIIIAVCSRGFGGQSVVSLPPAHTDKKQRPADQESSAYDAISIT
jgi:hypothetical protein